jgi:thioredoxin reductase (NADPH)
MYDVAVIGAGPAGICASIYAARYRLKTLLLSPDIGGWIAKAHKVENIPGIPSILGKELKSLYGKQIEANDITHAKEMVTKIEKKDGFVLKTNAGEHQARYVIYALGTIKRKLNVPGEDELLGKGVCLCATCDAPFFKNKRVAVIGGNDSGTTSALLIAEYATEVTIVELLPKLPSEPVWVDKVRENPKIKVITGDKVKEIKGDRVVRSVALDSGKELTVDGVFIEVGSMPDTAMAKESGVSLDQWNHIIVDKSQMTNIDRFYAAGDLTNGSNYMRQVVAAQAEGAIAAQAIYKRIMKGE